MARKASKMLDLKFAMFPVSILYVALVFWRKRVSEEGGGDKIFFLIE